MKVQQKKNNNCRINHPKFSDGRFVTVNTSNFTYRKADPVVQHLKQSFLCTIQCGKQEETCRGWKYQLKLLIISTAGNSWINDGDDIKRHKEQTVIVIKFINIHDVVSSSRNDITI